MDEKYFTNTLGLSCIENYLLGLLKMQGIEPCYLFYDSVLSLDELFDCFIDKGMKYEYFRGIKRLQSLAIKHGIISYSTVSDPFSEADYKTTANNEYILVRAKSEYIADVFHHKSWRNDHFVLLYSLDGNLFCFNDSTKSSALVENFEDLYDGEYISIKVLGNSSEDFFTLFKEKLGLSKENKIVGNYDEFSDLNILRDILLVYRIISKRILAFVNLYQVAVNFNFESIDKYLFKTEYLRNRNPVNKEFCKETIKYLYEIEEQLWRVLCKIEQMK